MHITDITKGRPPKGGKSANDATRQRCTNKFLRELPRLIDFEIMRRLKDE